MKTVNRAAPITVDAYRCPCRLARYARYAIAAAILIFIMVWSLTA